MGSEFGPSTEHFITERLSSPWNFFILNSIFKKEDTFESSWLAKLLAKLLLLVSLLQLTSLLLLPIYVPVASAVAVNSLLWPMLFLPMAFLVSQCVMVSAVESSLLVLLLLLLLTFLESLWWLKSLLLPTSLLMLTFFGFLCFQRFCHPCCCWRPYSYNELIIVLLPENLRAHLQLSV
jgi:hypothetical protein